MKKIWRCHICNDLHIGIQPPYVCPTCREKNAYVAVASREAEIILGSISVDQNREEFRAAVEALTEGKEFRINPDEEKVSALIQGVFSNQENHGLKYCPCRLIEKDFDKDLKLVCPCHFMVHETYRDHVDGECWCGLFVKRK